MTKGFKVAKQHTLLLKLFGFNSGFILCGILVVTMFSCSLPKANHSLANSKKGMKMENQKQDENKETIRKLYEEIFNTGHLELLNQIVSSDYTGPGGIKGPEGFAESINRVRAAFPDIKWTVEDLIAEGDKVMARWSWKGTNTASFDGFPQAIKKLLIMQLTFSSLVAIRSLKHGCKLTD